MAVMLGATGCAHVAVMAPAGPPVYLAPSDASLPVERRWRTWYVVWGVTPLDDKMPAEYIQREHLSELSVIVEDNIPDGLHSFLYSTIMPVGLVPQTIILKGSRTVPALGQ